MWSVVLIVEDIFSIDEAEEVVVVKEVVEELASIAGKLFKFLLFLLFPEPAFLGVRH